MLGVIHRHWKWHQLIEYTLHLDSTYLNMSRQQSALQLGSYHELLEFNLSSAKLCNMSSVVF